MCGYRDIFVVMVFVTVRFDRTSPKTDVVTTKQKNLGTRPNKTRSLKTSFLVRCKRLYNSHIFTILSISDVSSTFFESQRHTIL